MMIEIQDSRDDRIMEVKVIEALSEADFDHLEPVLQKHVAEISSPRLFLKLESFSGWEDASAFWADLQVEAQYIGKFSRVAIVGDSTWEEWLTKLIDPLTSTQIKYFSPDKAASARTWLSA